MQKRDRSCFIVKTRCGHLRAAEAKGKARGSKNGNNLLIQTIEKTSGVDFSRPYRLGYTGLDDRLLKKYVEDSARLWAEHVEELPVSTVGGAIGTHVGPGAVAVAFFQRG